MNSATAPSAYARWLRSVIALAIREAQVDAAVRAGQPAPSGFNPIPDTLLDLHDAGDVVVAVIPIPTEAAQIMQEQWPDAVPEGATRFPGFKSIANALGFRRVAEPRAPINRSEP